ncbi:MULTISPECIES: cytochrome P450 [unclassified Novosphingobium]|uniref:cytochrome P450 n=1 Tax=unclassified Novosphingobium TaxID=2644732 RepID=UPI00146EE744|nr:MULTISPECIES: cytochrome P450 [unclassified Novosphingobium]NMN07233.1 hypothetical protein [Novosphingobium sp. SG919]NMN89178.1 hypothetical protein [Novosphingobium sp. SG916]
MLTPANDLQNLNPRAPLPEGHALPLAGDGESLVDTTLANAPLPVPETSGGLGWGDPLARLLRDKARLGPVFRQGKRVMLLDARFNRLVLDDDGTQFAALGADRAAAARDAAGQAPAVQEAVLGAVFHAELARWRAGTVRVQPALAMMLARALVPAMTGLAAGSGAAERLAGALATLDDGGSLLRRAMPRGLPSSAMGARQAMARGLAQAGHTDPVMLETLQECHAVGLRLLCTLARHLAETPDWQDTLRAEVRSARAAGRTAPVALELVEMATHEAWRLMPAPLLVERRLVAPLPLGEHCLEAGAVVAISPAATHVDATLWPEPARFDPLRFSKARLHDRPGGAWLAKALLAPAVAQGVELVARQAVAHVLDRFALAPAGEGGKVALRLVD